LRYCEVIHELEEGRIVSSSRFKERPPVAQTSPAEQTSPSEQTSPAGVS